VIRLVETRKTNTISVNILGKVQLKDCSQWDKNIKLDHRDLNFED
jgi:hypothetical protein